MVVPHFSGSWSLRGAWRKWRGGGRVPEQLQPPVANPGAERDPGSPFPCQGRGPAAPVPGRSAGVGRGSAAGATSSSRSCWCRGSLPGEPRAVLPASRFPRLTFASARRPRARRPASSGFPESSGRRLHVPALPCRLPPAPWPPRGGGEIKHVAEIDSLRRRVKP